MKKIGLIVPDLIEVLSITAVYHDWETGNQMVCNSILTNDDHARMVEGKPWYVPDKLEKEAQKDDL